jgi:hypothetical protein
MSKTVEGLRTANEIALQEKEEPDYISFDAPPLDFSFKNIKHLSCNPPITQSSRTSSQGRERRRSPRKSQRPSLQRTRKRRSTLRGLRTESLGATRGRTR